jgi:hypothetical protein
MPRHRPTPEQRQSVTLLSGLGASAELIAAVIGVEVRIVESAYAAELAGGPDQVKLQAMQELFRAARGNGAGKVMAATRLLDLLTQDDKPEAGDAVRRSGKVRLVTCKNDNSLWDGAGERADVFDENGDTIVIVSDHELHF